MGAGAGGHGGDEERQGWLYKALGFYFEPDTQAANEKSNSMTWQRWEGWAVGSQLKVLVGGNV